MPQLSLIIAVYKNIAALDLILRGLEQQSFKDFEVVIAEDNEGGEMRDFIKKAQNQYFFTIKHISQPDNGFQKDKALNKSVAVSAADYLVFIDGDCIPNKHFLKAHFDNRETGFALFGRRVMLSETLTKQLYRDKKLKRLSFFNLLKSQSKRLDSAFYLPFLPNFIQNTTGIWGCNWSIHKKSIIAVNGFDEDFILPGYGEDTDIEWRLFKAGIRLKKIKNKAIQYHLHHKENYSDTLTNEKIMLKKQAEGNFFCENGLSKYL